MKIPRSFKSIHYLRMSLSYYYYRYLCLYKNNQKCYNNPDNSTFNSWLPTLNKYKKLVIIAGGPSANNMTPSQDYLYIVTNFGYKLINDLEFIYYVSELSCVVKYLKKGFNNKGWKGTILREEICSGSSSTKDTAEFILEYKRKYKRHFPEIFASDLQKIGPYKDNYDELENFIQTNLNMKFKHFNSGFGLVQIGYYIACKLNIPMDIYGLDAGIGGLVHFDGSKIESNAVSGDRVKRKLTILLNALYNQTVIDVNNYSYFFRNNRQYNSEQL